MVYFETKSVFCCQGISKRTERCRTSLDGERLEDRCFYCETRLSVWQCIRECDSILHWTWWWELCKTDHYWSRLQCEVPCVFHLRAKCEGSCFSRLARLGWIRSHWSREVDQSGAIFVFEQGRSSGKSTVWDFTRQVRDRRFFDSVWPQGTSKDSTLRVQLSNFWDFFCFKRKWNGRVCTQYSRVGRNQSLAAW